MDRLSIAIAVYVAFSGAVEQGLWQQVGPGDWLSLLVLVACFLRVRLRRRLAAAVAGSGSRGDRIAFLFAGGQKSIALGAPLAALLFPPAVAGLLLLPVLTLSPAAAGAVGPAR